MAKGKSKSGARDIHPTDAYRKELRKKELKKNKKDRAQTRAVVDMLSHPEKIEEEINRMQKESDENRLDKGLKDRIKELKSMYSVALKRQRALEQQQAQVEERRKQLFSETMEEPLLADGSSTLASSTSLSSSSVSTARSQPPLPAQPPPPSAAHQFYDLNTIPSSPPPPPPNFPHHQQHVQTQHLAQMSIPQHQMQYPVNHQSISSRMPMNVASGMQLPPQSFYQSVPNSAPAVPDKSSSTTLEDEKDYSEKEAVPTGSLESEAENDSSTDITALQSAPKATISTAYPYSQQAHFQPSVSRYQYPGHGQMPMPMAMPIPMPRPMPIQGAPPYAMHSSGYIIGGQNGIPLPPPRPPFGRPMGPASGPFPGMIQPNYYNQPQHNISDVNRPHFEGAASSDRRSGDHRSGRGRGNAALEHVDPLDPSAKGYTQRFVAPAPVQQQQFSSRGPQPSVAELGSPEGADALLGPEMGPAFGPDVGSAPRPAFEPALGLGPPLGRALEPPLGPELGPTLGPAMGPALGPELCPNLPSADYLSSQAAPVSGSTPSTLGSFNVSLEEIMRRRMQTADPSTVPLVPTPQQASAAPAPYSINAEEIMRRRMDSVSVPSSDQLKSNAYDNSTHSSSSLTPSYNHSYATGPGGNSALGISAVPAPSSVTLLKGPKVVKTDAEVTSFVPAALRIKRNLGTTAIKANPSKVLKSEPLQEASRPNPPKVRGIEIFSAPTTSSSMGKSLLQSIKPPTASVDDAYSSFMDEINELAGL